MVLIKHMIFVDVNEEKKLLINSLKGTMDEINFYVYKTLKQWQNCDEIIAENEQEMELYNHLQARGYLVENHGEELALKEKTLSVLRKFHSFDKSNRKNITFIMTYSCNFRCPYCFEGDNYVKKEVITPEMIDAALVVAGGGLENISLFGGEPLLLETRKSVEYLIEKAPDKKYSITTNGYYLEEFIDLLCKIDIDYISITIDGDEPTHNRKRYLTDGSPTYQKIIKGIEACLENGINIRIRLNAQEDEVEMGKNMQAYLAKKYDKYKNLLVFEMATMMSYSSETKNSMLIEMFRSLLTCNNEERARKNRQLASMMPIVNAITVNAPMKPLYSFCYAHENNLAVDPYGDMYTCLVSIGREHARAGKYYPTVEYKENSIYNRNIEKIPECRNCIYALLCGGGCPNRLQDYNDVFKPACESIKNHIHNLLPKLYLVDQEHKSVNN
ncbi:MAG: radical SAM protein [Defluviitaleaceae bacterium]|nr:radical SAM protein [Defluviitaleaceae bacterium]MCL2274341.1 radical SAM protein [Defluviitaleaceae bacterium]